MMMKLNGDESEKVNSESKKLFFVMIWWWPSITIDILISWNGLILFPDFLKRFEYFSAISSHTFTSIQTLIFTLCFQNETQNEVEINIEVYT